MPNLAIPNIHIGKGNDFQNQLTQLLYKYENTFYIIYINIDFQIHQHFTINYYT